MHRRNCGKEKVTGDPAEQTKQVADLTRQFGDLQIDMNIARTLLTGFLVMFMQLGFALLETGLTRAKNVVRGATMFEGTAIKKFEGRLARGSAPNGGHSSATTATSARGLFARQGGTGAERPPTRRFGDLSTRPPYLAIKLRKSG